MRLNKRPLGFRLDCRQTVSLNVINTRKVTAGWPVIQVKPSVSPIQLLSNRCQRPKDCGHSRLTALNPRFRRKRLAEHLGGDTSVERDRA
jgi:hypothetical protein